MKMISKYKYGFKSEVRSNTLKSGLSVDIIKEISRIRGEPKYILDFRLHAFDILQRQTFPSWANLSFNRIDLNKFSYYSTPDRDRDNMQKLEKDIEKLGISKDVKKDVAVEVVFDSVSLGVSLKDRLKKEGIIFSSISEAVRDNFDIVSKYLGSVVPASDNYFAALNSACFSDGSFIFVPKGVKCPVELSTYFRMNEKRTGQFERTLIIAEEGASLSYLEGCTAPSYVENQLHAAVVEIVALDKASVKYSTVQNWYSGEGGLGGVYNFVTKRGVCKERAKIVWAQVEIGSAVTWKYPSCILEGDGSSGEFYSVSITEDHMQTDTGTKMIHKGKDTRSTIISKSIASGRSRNSYRGVVAVEKNAKGSRNFTKCDSMIVGKDARVSSFPHIECRNSASLVEHEAVVSRVAEEGLFFLESRGIDREMAVRMIVNGFCQEIITHLPLEFAVEAREILAMKLEKAIG